LHYADFYRNFPAEKVAKTAAAEHSDAPAPWHCVDDGRAMRGTHRSAAAEVAQQQQQQQLPTT